MNTFRTLLTAQVAVTLFLAVLLWSLYRHLRRQEFNRWWAWAWTSSAAFLALGRVSVSFESESTLLRGGLVLTATLVGFLAVPLLAFGVLSFRTPHAISRRMAIAGIGGALVLGALTFAASLWWLDPAARLSVRQGARTLALGAMLLFCAWVFYERARATWSWAVTITGGCCLLHGVNQLLLAAILLRVAGMSAFAARVDQSILNAVNLLAVDVVLIAGICLGMILLLIEEHQRAEHALSKSVSQAREVAAQNAALQAEISKRQMVEQELRRSEEKFASAFHSGPCAMTITSLATGRFIDVNASFERQTGYRKEDVLNRTSEEVGLWPDHDDRVNYYSDVSARGGSSEREVALRTKSGRTMWAVISAEAITVGGERCVLAVGVDVTARKEAEASARELQDQLAHAGRVVALGTLTGSLAHEINQPLAAITTNAHTALALLGASKPDVAEVRAALSDIKADTRRIDEVLRHLRSLLRKERRDYDAVDVNSLVTEVLALVHSDIIRAQISLDVGLAPNLMRVLGDRIQLQQVVLNLVLNACEAVRSVDVSRRLVQLTTTAEDGNVIVSVRDRGVGFSLEEIDRMFEPFFTTTAHGMGLGLSICRTIIDSHGGLISARPNPDHGLTCWFSLTGLQSVGQTTSEQPVHVM
jgi:PAS domain S-box-containing protein